MLPVRWFSTHGCLSFHGGASQNKWSKVLKLAGFIRFHVNFLLTMFNMLQCCWSWMYPEIRAALWSHESCTPSEHARVVRASIWKAKRAAASNNDQIKKFNVPVQTTNKTAIGLNLDQNQNEYQAKAMHSPNWFTQQPPSLPWTKAGYKKCVCQVYRAGLKHTQKNNLPTRTMSLHYDFGPESRCFNMIQRWNIQVQTCWMKSFKFERTIFAFSTVAMLVQNSELFQIS